MDHYFRDIPGLGNVTLSRHAKDRLREFGVTEHQMLDVLRRGQTIPDGQDIVWREKNGIRIVILKRPTPFRGSMLATTAYKVDPKLRAR